MGKPPKNRTLTTSIPEELFPELAGLVDTIGDGVAVVVDGGRYVYVSEGAARMTGYSVDELFAMGLEKLIHSDERANIRKMIVGHLSPPADPLRYETAILHKDGSKIWSEVTGSRIFWKGKPAIMVLLKDLTPRLQGEAELERQETRFRDLLEMMGEGLGANDTQGVITYVNSHLHEMLGYAREEMIGQHISMFYPEELREKIKNKVHRRQKGIRESYEFDMIRKDGRKLPVRTTSVPLIDSAGLYCGSVAVLTDMTAIKKAERVQKEHTRQLEILNRILVCGAGASDITVFLEEIMEVTVELMQFAAGAAYLVDREAGVARIVAERGSPVPANRDELETVRVGSEPYGSVYVDGKPIIRKMPVKIDEGEFLYYLAIVVPIVSNDEILGSLNLGMKDDHIFLPQEITTLQAIGVKVGASIDHIRFQEALRESEAGFRAVAENANEGISISSEEGRIVFLNAPACEILGYRYSEMIGMAFKDLLHEECCQSVTERFRERISGESALSQFEVFVMHKSGKTVPVEVNVSRIMWHGRPASLALIRDITERKRQEEKDRQYAENLEAEVEKRTKSLRLSERQLAEAERQASVGRMAARIAHEINNPLAGVKNSLRLIHDALPESHPYYDYIGIIDSEIDRMAAIVRQMYTIHKPEAATIRKVNVVSIVNEVVDLLQPSFKKYHVVARVDFQDPQLTATLAEGSFRQVLFNLIQNAIEVSSPGEVVEIGTKKVDGRLILEIRDRGPGIPDEIRDKVYEPFFTTKSELAEAGLGLGLPNALSLVRKSLHGEISFDNATDGGTLFRISIPLEADKNTGGPE